MEARKKIFEEAERKLAASANIGKPQQWNNEDTYTRSTRASRTGMGTILTQKQQDLNWANKHAIRTLKTPKKKQLLQSAITI